MVVGDDVSEPTFRMSLNRVAELVQVFGPTIYEQNPYRHTSPRSPVLSDSQLQLIYGPQAQFVYESLSQRLIQKEAVAALQSTWLNYLPDQTDLKRNSIFAIDEGLITGRGVLWHEMRRLGPSAPGFVPCATWGSCDDLFGDADGDTVREWTWAAKREFIPRWVAEQDYGLRPRSLARYAKGESASRQGMVDASEKGIYRRKQGHTADTVTIYKVWSKCGLGHELAGPANDEIHSLQVDELRQGLTRFGRHVFLVLCEGCPFPLNVPPETLRADGGSYTEEEVFERTRWPAPFYEKNDGWPFSELDFHPMVKNGGWPMAHFKPAMAEMMAANWIYSFLLGRIHWTSRVLLFYADHINQDIRDAVENGRDLEMVPYQEALVKDINQVIQQFEHKEVQQDLWRILSELNTLIDKRTGLTDLIYGMTGTQMRSAAEAEIREGLTNIRPAAMAATARDWQTDIAVKQGMLSRWKNPGRIVSHYLGEQEGGVFGSLWDQFVHVPLDYLNPESIRRVVSEFEYEVVADTMKRPSVERDRENLSQIAQTMVPLYHQEYMQTGDPSMMNSFIEKMNESFQMTTPLLPDRRAEVMAMQQQQQPVDEFGNPIDPNAGMPVDPGIPLGV